MGRAAFLALALALAGCAKRPPIVLGERMPRGCTTETKSERCTGWFIDRVLMSILFTPYRDAEIHAYVASIGARLARANGDKRRWTFRVLDDDSPQAYVGFNATIYITRGALAILRDEAELAAVIGHEMGHTIAGHHREELFDLVRDVEVHRWRELRYARDDEIQADELAVVYLARAGYDVHAVERMLRALGGYVGTDDEDASDNRHTVWRERVTRVAALATRYPTGERGIDRYNARLARLVVGDDPRVIAMLGETALFGHAGLALDLPRGTKATVVGGQAILAMPGEIVATAQLIDRSVAKAMVDDTDDETHHAVRAVGDVALVITVVKDKKATYDHVKAAKVLLAATRTARPDELARIVPTHFDPTKPRAYWAR